MRKNLLLLAVMLLATVSATADRAVGMDLSLLPKYEQAGVVYYESNGSTRIPDVLTWVVQQKRVNYVRVRLFVDPSNDWAQGIAQGQKGQNQLAGDLASVTALAQRIKAAGAGFLLDIHYSDGWADPSRQVMPKRWAEVCTSYEQLEDSVYRYTHDVLTHLVAAGAAPDMVQVGNEITYGIFYEEFNAPVTGTKYVNYAATAAGQAGLNCVAHSTGNYSTTENWTHFTQMLQAGCRAVREVCPDAEIMLHIERSGQEGIARAWFEKMQEYEVDYDIMGLSYYPEYHGTIATLSKTLQALENVCDKPIMLVEFGYSNGWAIGGSGGYTPGKIGFYKKGDTSKSCPQAQADCIRALVDKLLTDHPRVTGLFYWFAEENESDYSKHAPYADGWRNTGLWSNEASNVASNLSPALQVKAGAALPGLDALAEFAEVEEGIEQTAAIPADNAYYTLLGERLREQPTQSGIYIHNHKVLLVP